MQPDHAIEFWDGDTKEIAAGLTLITGYDYLRVGLKHMA